MFHKKAGTKYKSKKVTIDWIVFDSMIEWSFYEWCKEAKASGEIVDYEIKPKFILQDGFRLPSGEKIEAIKYFADFAVTAHDGVTTIIDTKGEPTEVAKIKRKMFLSQFPEKPLKWLVKFQWQFVDYFENEKRKKANKKQKEVAKTLET